jgi:GNAT superfamily N-acetyltransferase
MRVFIKDVGGNKIQAWVEDWDQKQDEWETVSQANCIVMGKKCMVDTIDTPPKYRKKGYATAIIRELQKYFSEVAPIGVTASGRRFWDKLGMKDALGEEVL